MRRWAFLPVFLLLGVASCLAKGEIKELKIEGLPGRMRVTLPFEGTLTTRLFNLSNPPRVVVDISDALYKLSSKILKVDDEPISRIHIDQYDQKTVRLIIYLTEEVEPRIGKEEGFLFIDLPFSEDLKLRKEFESGVRLYKEGKLQAALDKFKEVAAKDPAALRYMERIKAKLKVQAAEAEARLRERQRVESKERIEQLAEEELKAEEERERKVSQHFLKGRSHFKRGELYSCIEEMKKVLELDPTHLQADALLQKALERISLEEEKERRRMDASLQDHLRRGEELFRRGDYVKAKDEFQEVLMVDPGNEDSLFYLKRIREEEIVEARSKALERQMMGVKERMMETTSRMKEGAEIHFRQGEYYYRNGELQAASSQLEMALELNPDHRGARKLLKRVTTKLRELKEEKKEPKKEKPLTMEEKIKAHLFYGRNLLKEGKFSEAIRKGYIILSLAPDHGEAKKLIEEAHLFYGRNLLKEGKFSEAIREGYIILSLAPDHGKAKELIEEAEDQRRREEKRSSLLEKKIMEEEWATGVDRSYKEIFMPKEKEIPVKRPLEPPIDIPSPEEINEGYGTRIDIDLVNIHLRDVVTHLKELVSEKGFNVNLVLDEEAVDELLSPNVTIRLKDTPLVDALDIILRSKGLSYSLEPDLIWITTEENIAYQTKVTIKYHLKHGLQRISPVKTK